jgi:hypothetical protein
MVFGEEVWRAEDFGELRRKREEPMAESEHVAAASAIAFSHSLDASEWTLLHI